MVCSIRRGKAFVGTAVGVLDLVSPRVAQRGASRNVGVDASRLPSVPPDVPADAARCPAGRDALPGRRC